MGWPPVRARSGGCAGEGAQRLMDAGGPLPAEGQAAASHARLTPGSRIATRYDLRDRIGAGAFGTVWEAYDRRLKRLVAVKVMPLGPPEDALAQENLHRFRAEAEAVARLSHGGIVTVHDVGEEADFAWFAMELIIGETLKSVLDRGERPPVAETVRIILQLLEALQHAHARGIVHRDVKPANILLVMGLEEGLGEVKLADFGIARIGDRGRTRDGVVIGTPAAMAPEQLRGEPADRRADLWAVGLILYHLLTGRPAFPGTGFAALRSALNDTPPPPSSLVPDLPPGFDAVLERALAKDPEERFGDAAGMAQALRQAMRGAPTEPPPMEPPPWGGEPAADTVRLEPGGALLLLPPPPRPAPPSRRLPERLGFLALGLVLGVALAGLAWEARQVPRADALAVASPPAPDPAPELPGPEAPAPASPAPPATVDATASLPSPAAPVPAAPLPLCPAERLALRAGSHPSYGRLVFDWRRSMRYDFATLPGGARLSFPDAGCAPPVATLALPRNIRAVTLDPISGEIRLETAPGTRARAYRLEGRVVVDVQDGG